MSDFYSYAALKKMSDEDVIAAHDQEAQRVSAASLEFWRGEMARREAAKQGQAVVNMTRTLLNLTWVIALLTVVSAGFVIYSALHG